LDLKAMGEGKSSVVPYPARFSHTLSRVGHFLAQMRAVDERLASRLSELTASFAVHDTQLATLKVLCEALLLEAEAECATVEELMWCDSFNTFAAVEPIPPKLLESNSMPHLLGYIRATPIRAKRRAIDQACAKAEDSAAMAKFREEARAEQHALVQESAEALAQSDHLPIRVELRLAGDGVAKAGTQDFDDSAASTSDARNSHENPRCFHVVSHNIQELIEDGINLYASCLASHHLKCISLEAGSSAPSARDVVSTLIESLLSTSVREAQVTAVKAFVHRHVRMCDAVCLQELSDEVVEVLKTECEVQSPPWFFLREQQDCREEPGWLM